MNNRNLLKGIKNSLVIALMVVSCPIGANAEWKKDYNGWWNTEGSSWSVGWREIDGKWYYFYSNGYMAHDVTINGYTLGSDGALIQSVKNKTSYEELGKLPKKYSYKIAKQNGDVIQSLGSIKDNRDKLDDFIENYKNKKLNIGDMVRISIYWDEGGVTIYDLIIDSDYGIKLVVDNTRDEDFSKKDRIIEEQKVADVCKRTNESLNNVEYYVKTNNGEEIFLGFSDV